MIDILFCTDRLTTPTPHSRPTWPRSGRCLGWTDIPLTRAPCWKEKPSPGYHTAPRRFRASPRTSLKSFWLFRSSSLDLSEVSLAQEDDRPRVPNQAEDSRFYPSSSFWEINILETFSLFGPSLTWRSIAASYRTIGYGQRRLLDTDWEIYFHADIRIVSK